MHVQCMALVGHKVYDWHFLQSNAALCITTYAGAAASQKGEHCMALETQLLSYMPLGLHDKGLFCLLLSTDIASFCVCFSIALRLRQIWCPCKTGRCNCALQGSLLSLLPACLRGICILGSSLSSSMQKTHHFMLWGLVGVLVLLCCCLTCIHVAAVVLDITMSLAVQQLWLYTRDMAGSVCNVPFSYKPEAAVSWRGCDGLGYKHRLDAWHWPHCWFL